MRAVLHTHITLPTMLLFVFGKGRESSQQVLGKAFLHHSCVDLVIKQAPEAQWACSSFGLLTGRARAAV